MRTSALFVVATAFIGVSGFALAQHQGHQMPQGQSAPGNMHQQMMQQKGGMDHSMHGKAGAASTTPSTAAFEAANAKMHKDMAIKFSGDADVDFIKGMIPHHQGAIEMAKVVLGFGKDPETKKLAQDIIAAQEKEIAMMTEWLKKKGQ